MIEEMRLPWIMLSYCRANVTTREAVSLIVRRAARASTRWVTRRADEGDHFDEVSLLISFHTQKSHKKNKFSTLVKNSFL